jgi:hypothetical protein
VATLAWKLNRLRTMGAAEIGHRVGRALQARWQAVGVGRRRQPPAPAMRFGQPWLASWPQGLAVDRWREAADRVLAGRWDVFSLSDQALGFPPDWNRDPLTSKRIPLEFGKRLEYRDTARVGDIRHVWELNRHAELNTLAQAYALTGEMKYAEGCRTLLVSWFEQCPYPLGANWASSLELAIRLNNWAFAWHLLGGAGSPLFERVDGEVLCRRWLDAIYQHCDFVAGYLSRHSSANNHLLGELAGLYIASLTWPCWKESAGWRAQARRELEIEALKQNAPDGGNREQAFYYHHEALEWMLLAGLWGQANGEHFSAEYWARMEAMLVFIFSVMDAGGHVPMVGDADDAHIVRFEPEQHGDPYRSLLAMGAVLFQGADFAAKAGRLDDKGRWLLGDGAVKTFADLTAARHIRSPRRAFPDVGYYLLGSDFDTADEVRVLVDAGPLGYLSIAAHGHADALAFTLSVGGHEVLIDPGTYTYQGDMKWREYFRGTSAHNTLTVDGVNQSQSGGRFMWLAHGNGRCIRFEQGDARQALVAEQDGYRRLTDPLTHQREWGYEPTSKILTVIDRLSSRGAHEVAWFWHFAEAVAVSFEPGRVIARVPGWRIELVVPDGCGAPVLLRGSEQPMGGWISRRFEQRTPACTVSWHARSSGDTSWATRIAVIREAAGV